MKKINKLEYLIGISALCLNFPNCSGSKKKLHMPLSPLKPLCYSLFERLLFRHQQSKNNPSAQSSCCLEDWHCKFQHGWLAKNYVFGQKTELIGLPLLGSELKARREEEGVGKGRRIAFLNSVSGTEHIIQCNFHSLPPLGDNILYD